MGPEEEPEMLICQGIIDLRVYNETLEAVSF